MEKLKNLLALLTASLFVTPYTSNAQGIITFDPTSAKNSYERIVQGAQQLGHEVQELENQARELENMVQNTVAPAAYIWDQATNSIERMQYLSDQYKYYQEYGGIQGYLEQFGDTSLYSSSPCYQLSLNCDANQIDKLWKERQRISNVQKEANNGALLAQQQQQENLKQQAETLEKINATSHNIQGRLQSTETTNMYLSHIAAQQQQANQALLANAVAEANERAKRAAEEAKIEASDRAFYAHPDDSYFDSYKPKKRSFF